MFSIYSFRPVDGLDLNRVVKNTYRFLDGTVYVLDESGCNWKSSRIQGEGRDEFGTVRGFERPFSTLARVASRSQGWAACFRVTPRVLEPEDIEAAKAAEARSGTSGLAAVAEKCQTVWEVEAEIPPEFPKSMLPAAPAASLSFAAILAQTALGPILFEDGSLLDVKTAWDRVGELVKKPAA